MNPGDSEFWHWGNRGIGQSTESVRSKRSTLVAIHTNWAMYRHDSSFSVFEDLVVISCHFTPGWSVWNYANLFHPAMWDVHVRKRWDNHCHMFRFMLFCVASAPSALIRFGDGESRVKFCLGVAWEVQRQRSHSVQKSLRGARYFGKHIHGSWYF